MHRRDFIHGTATAGILFPVAEIVRVRESDTAFLDLASGPTPAELRWYEEGDPWLDWRADVETLHHPVAESVHDLFEGQRRVVFVSIPGSSLPFPVQEVQEVAAKWNRGDVSEVRVAIPARAWWLRRVRRHADGTLALSKDGLMKSERFRRVDLPGTSEVPFVVSVWGWSGKGSAVDSVAFTGGILSVLSDTELRLTRV